MTELFTHHIEHKLPGTEVLAVQEGRVQPIPMLGTAGRTVPWGDGAYCDPIQLLLRSCRRMAAAVGPGFVIHQHAEQPLYLIQHPYQWVKREAQNMARRAPDQAASSTRATLNGSALTDWLLTNRLQKMWETRAVEPRRKLSALSEQTVNRQAGRRGQEERRQTEDNDSDCKETPM